MDSLFEFLLSIDSAELSEDYLDITIDESIEEIVLYGGRPLPNPVTQSCARGNNVQTPITCCNTLCKQV